MSGLARASTRAELTTGLEVGKGILDTAGGGGGDAALVTRRDGGRAEGGMGGDRVGRGGEESDASW